MQRHSLMETYLTSSTPKTTGGLLLSHPSSSPPLYHLHHNHNRSSAHGYGSEVSMLRSLRLTLEQEISDRDRVIGEYRVQVAQVEEENERYRKELQRMRSDCEESSQIVENCRKCLGEKEKEKVQLMECAHRDIQTIITAQREQQRLYEQEVDKWKHKCEDLQRKVSLLEASLNDVATVKTSELEAKLRDTQRQAAAKAQESQDLSLQMTRMTSDLDAGARDREEEGGKVMAHLDTLSTSLTNLNGDITRQRHALRCVLHQLGLGQTAKDWPTPKSLSSSSDILPPQSGTALLHRVKVVADAATLVLAACNEQRHELAETLIQLVKRRKEEDVSEAQRESRRAEERDLFHARLHEMERDREEERRVLLAEREELRQIRSQQEEVLMKLGVTRVGKEVGVQNTLLTLQRANVHNSCQTDLQSTELEQFGLHVAELREQIFQLEKERAQWTQLSTKYQWPPQMSTVSFLSHR